MRNVWGMKWRDGAEGNDSEGKGKKGMVGRRWTAGISQGFETTQLEIIIEGQIR